MHIKQVVVRTNTVQFHGIFMGAYCTCVVFTHPVHVHGIHIGCTYTCCVCKHPVHVHSIYMGEYYVAVCSHPVHVQGICMGAYYTCCSSAHILSMYMVFTCVHIMLQFAPTFFMCRVFAWVYITHVVVLHTSCPCTWYLHACILCCSLLPPSSCAGYLHGCILHML